ncbi:MAG: ABC transporter substrate-binding protein [Spirochaetales bacterium]|nr:ABC transporter substrate-binding protein [Spirochaetales bacterium]
MKKYILLLILSSLFVLLFVSQTTTNVISIWGPATPSSVPLVIAAEKLPNTKITIFSDHSQASALFLKGETQILFTGLDVGINFYKNKAPVVMLNSYVTGLTYLVTYGIKVSSFKELKGKSIYIPFEGSPIEEIVKFFVEKDGLVYKKDITPVYSPFPSSLELLKQGKAEVVALPEPFVTMASSIPNVYISFGFKDYYEKLTGKKNGYPQVGAFAMKNWAINNIDYIKLLHAELAKAIELIKNDPQTAIKIAAPYFSFPQPVLLKAIGNTSFNLSYSNELLNEVFSYYQSIGIPLDPQFKELFFIY